MATATNTDAPNLCSSDVGPGLWYTFIGDGKAFEILAVTSGWNAYVNLLSGSCGSLVCEAYSFLSTTPYIKNFPTKEGTTYYIYIEYISGTVGAFDLIWNCLPANDVCMGAKNISCGTNLTGVDIIAATNIDAPLVCSSLDEGLWYTFTGDGTALEISAMTDGWEAYISLYSGNCAGLVCEKVSNIGATATINNFLTANGTTYYLYVEYWSGTAGTFDLIWNCPPSNDLCSGAISISCGTNLINYDASGATAYGAPVRSPIGGCGFGNSGVWFTFVGDGYSVRNLKVTGNGWIASWSLFSGDCNNLNCIPNQRNTVFDPEPTLLTLTGETYYLYVEARDGETIGTFDLIWPCPPINDICSGAIEIDRGSIFQNIDISNAISPEPTAEGNNLLSDGLWYTFIGDGKKLDIFVESLDWSSGIILFSGSCSILTREFETSTFPSTSNPEIRNFQTILGERYYLYIYNSESYKDNSSTFNFYWFSPPSNDLCSGAMTLEGGTILNNVSIWGATSEDAPDICEGDNAVGLWYKFIGDGNSYDLSFSVNGASFFPNWFVWLYAGSCDNLNCLGVSWVGTIPNFKTVQGITYYAYVVYEDGKGKPDETFNLEVSLPLPVELTSFEVLVKGENVLLTWETASELNNAGFEVEKSKDGVVWNKIGFVAGNGTTLITQQYAFEDLSAAPGLWYYRLKQVDFDGQFEYSEVRSASITYDLITTLYPNPTNGTVYFKGLLNEPDVKYVVRDQLGRAVKSGTLVNNQIDFAEIPSGLYHVILMVSQETIVKQVIKE